MSERKIIEIKAAIEGIEQSVNRIAKGEDKVNWKQARVDAAVAAMTAMLASPELMQVVTNPLNVVEKSFQSRVAKMSVQYADSLISELQRVPTHETK